MPQSAIPTDAARQSDRRWLSLLLRGLLSVLLLALILQHVDAGLFWPVVRSVDIEFLLLSVSLFFPAQLLAAYRWYFLLRQLDRTLPFWSIARHNMLGRFSSFFLPGQISGDVVRAIAVAHGKEQGTAYAVSVLVDKLALLSAKAFFVLLGTWWSEQLRRFVAVRVVALGVLLLALTVLVFLCRYRSDHVPQSVMCIGERLPLARPRMLSLAGWLDLPRVSYRDILVILTMGFILQLSDTASGYIVARSFHIPIGVVDWAAISATASVVQAVPITIGGLGVREGAFAGMLALYDVPRAQAIAFSLVSFVLVAVLTALGWFVLDSAYIHRLQAMQSSEQSDSQVS
jgi:uncharacterized membrane protein YbhN (UPF0104 family)